MEASKAGEKSTGAESGREGARGNGKKGFIALNAWAQLLMERGAPCGSGEGEVQSVRVWRRDTVRLLPTPEQEELLQRVGDAAAKLINMENFRRRRLFFEKGKVDYSWKSAWERRETAYSEIYKLLGSANFHETCRFISEQWKSFLELLKAKKEGKLEPWRELNPPGYRKREKLQLPIILIRFDNYEVDLERKVLRLGYWNAEIPFAGKPKWLAKGERLGRLAVVYDGVKKRWYAKIAVKVTLQIERNPRSSLKAGIDLGREILAAVAVEDGTALLYRGSVLKSDRHYFEKRIAAIDRMLSGSKTEGVDGSALREERRRLHGKRKRKRSQVLANMAAHVAQELATRGVSVAFVGYPKDTARDRAGKGDANVRDCWKLMLRLAATLENYGIAAFEVPEEGTSKLCARHGCRVERMPRGLVKCPRGHVMHSDVNAAMNILLRGARLLGCRVELPERVKVLSFTPTPSGIVEKEKRAATG